MAQQEIYYRPPSEADSFIIRVMSGCPHNQCTFCGMFKDVPCKVIPLEQIFAGIEQDAGELGPTLLPKLTSLYLEGGDPLALPTRTLLRIMHHAKKHFPHLQRIASYASAQFVVRKTVDELRILAESGLQRVYIGLESGTDSILKATRKGCSREDLLRSGELLRHAGIENDVSIMLGIGGLNLSKEHAIDTASLLNATMPSCVRIRTFVPTRNTTMGEDYINGTFQLMNPHEILRELHMLVMHLTQSMHLLSEHWTNFISFSAMIPQDKSELINLLNEACQLPLTNFRPLGLGTSAS